MTDAETAAGGLWMRSKTLGLSDPWDEQKAGTGNEDATKDGTAKTPTPEQETKVRDVRVTVLERQTHPYGAYRHSGRRRHTTNSRLHALDADCVGYHDSSLEDAHLYPASHKYSYRSHLKKAAQQKAKLKKDKKFGVADRAAKEEEVKKCHKHHGKARGLQRNPNAVGERNREEAEVDENRWIFM